MNTEGAPGRGPDTHSNPDHVPSESSHPSGLVRIVCVDGSLEEDLMFRQTLAQSLSRFEPRTPMILVVGAGESVWHTLGLQDSASRRTERDVRLGDGSNQAQYDRLMRETGRDYVAILTDLGISSVGFFGADRKILSVGSAGIRVGQSLQIMVGLSRSGVVSVLVSSCLDDHLHLVDLRPIDVCEAICNALEQETYNMKGEIVIPVLNIPQSLSSYMNSDEPVPWKSIADSGIDIPESVSSFAVNATASFFISTVSQIGGLSRIRVGV